MKLFGKISITMVTELTFYVTIQGRFIDANVLQFSVNSLAVEQQPPVSRTVDEKIEHYFRLGLFKD